MISSFLCIRNFFSFSFSFFFNILRNTSSFNFLFCITKVSKNFYCRNCPDLFGIYTLDRVKSAYTTSPKGWLTFLQKDNILQRRIYRKVAKFRSESNTFHINSKAIKMHYCKNFAIL